MQIEVTLGINRNVTADQMDEVHNWLGELRPVGKITELVGKNGEKFLKATLRVTDRLVSVSNLGVFLAHVPRKRQDKIEAAVFSWEFTVGGTPAELR